MVSMPICPLLDDFAHVQMLAFDRQLSSATHFVKISPWQTRNPICFYLRVLFCGTFPTNQGDCVRQQHIQVVILLVLMLLPPWSILKTTYVSIDPSSPAVAAWSLLVHVTISLLILATLTAVAAWHRSQTSPSSGIQSGLVA